MWEPRGLPLEEIVRKEVTHFRVPLILMMLVLGLHLNLDQLQEVETKT